LYSGTYDIKATIAGDITSIVHSGIVNVS
jgi:hypothetical protein